MGERLTLAGGVRHEPAQSSDAPGQGLHFFDVLWWFHIQDGLDLIRIRLNPAAANHEPKKFSRAHFEHAFLGVELHTKGPQYVKRLPQVVAMVDITLTFYNHVINVNLHSFPNKGFE